MFFISPRGPGGAEKEEENVKSSETEEQEDSVEQENLESAETNPQENSVEEENLESTENEEQEKRIESKPANYRSIINVSETTTISEIENIDELLKSEEIAVFLKNYGANRKIILPVPTEELIGKTFLILNTNNSPWVITAEKGVKINNQFEKNLIRSYHFLRLITDGEKYYLI